MGRLAIKVVWLDGTEEYLKVGHRPTPFTSTAKAKEMKSFMLEGMSDEVQSINIVPYPNPTEAST